MSFESHKNMAVGTDILRLKACVRQEQGCNMWQKCTLHHKTFLCSSVAKSKPTWPYSQLTLEGKQRSTSVAVTEPPHKACQLKYLHIFRLTRHFPRCPQCSNSRQPTGKSSVHLLYHYTRLSPSSQGPSPTCLLKRAHVLVNDCTRETLYEN